MTGSFEVAKGNIICITTHKIPVEECYITLRYRLTAAKIILFCQLLFTFFNDVIIENCQIPPSIDY